MSSQGGPQGMVSTYTSRRKHRKALRDSVYAITKPNIKRLARRGGVKRISVDVYNEIRHALQERLKTANSPIIGCCETYVIHRDGKAVTKKDVHQSLEFLGCPVWGFDSNEYAGVKKQRT
ncbi:related to histone H4 [Fusarium fujikuroi]|nr:related to histone H4 [Fusarium fujikuroi]